MSLFDISKKEFNVRFSVQEPGKSAQFFHDRVVAMDWGEAKKVLKARHPYFKALLDCKEIKSETQPIASSPVAQANSGRRRIQDAEAHDEQSWSDEDTEAVGSGAKRRRSGKDTVAASSQARQKYSLRIPPWQLLVAAVVIGLPVMFFLGVFSSSRLLVTSQERGYTLSDFNQKAKPILLKNITLDKNYLDSNQHYFKGELIPKNGKGKVSFNITTARYFISAPLKKITIDGKEFDAYEVSNRYLKSKEGSKVTVYMHTENIVDKDNEEQYNKYRMEYLKTFAYQKGINLANYNIEYSN